MLSRSLSFGRRGSRAPKSSTDLSSLPIGGSKARAPTDENTAPDKATVPTKSQSSVSKVVRSVSFSRRNRKPSTPPADERTASEESSESRPPSRDDDDAAAGAASVVEGRRAVNEVTDQEVEAAPLTANLQGWLRKRHQKQPSVWARRFFAVNDTRGTVAYSKGEKGGRSKPSVVLSLQDVAVVKLVELDDARHAFVISCPPVTLTAAAEDREEARMWVVQLNKRVRVWREKAEAKTKVAVVAGSDNAPPPAAVELDGGIENGTDAEPASPPRHNAVLEPDASEPSGTPHRAASTHRAGCAADGWSNRPRDAAPPHRRVEAPPALMPGIGRISEEVSSVETIQAFESDDEGPSPPPAANAGTSPHRPLDPWDVMPTRDLNDLLSSDEDEDDDGLYAPLPARQRSAPATREQEPPPAAPATTHVRAAPVYVEPEAAAPTVTEPERGPMSWLDAMPAEALEADDAPVHSGEREQAHAGMADDWDSEEEEDSKHLHAHARAAARQEPTPPIREPLEELEPESEPEPEPTHIGDGIVADTNFVDDDWDD